ncbi:MAG TPA: hypothetical protein VJK54_04050 [Chthoniobacterales bacterium]|nr:hypothetical protein [Chthoniobacterales bacterium]
MSCFVRAEVFFKDNFGNSSLFADFKNNTSLRHSSGRWNLGESHYRIDDPIT